MKYKLLDLNTEIVFKICINYRYINYIIIYNLNY